MNDLTKRKRSVIKIGTNILTTREGRIDLAFMAGIASQVSQLLQTKNHEIAIVSSGSIACGAKALGIPPRTIPEKQAAASVGQCLLMRNYDICFGQNEWMVGQLLLTKKGLSDSLRADHARNTILTLFSEEVIPIINENDSIETEEIIATSSDNDKLALAVAELIEADQLILLTDIDGLHTKNPKLHTDAERISVVDGVTPEILELADDLSELNRSRGGMESKLSVAKQGSENGLDVWIASGRNRTVITDIFSGKSIGTYFQKQEKNNQN